MSGKEAKDGPLTFLIQGSGAKPYAVVFSGSGAELKAVCSCPAGRHKFEFCKHIANLLKGETGKIIEGAENMPELMRRAEGSPLVERAQWYTPAPERIPPMKGVSSLRDFCPIVEEALAKANIPHLWHEYSEGEQGASLEIIQQKYFKNGKPHKHPSCLLSFVFSPYVFDFVDGENGALTYAPVGESKRPYAVDNLYYGSIGTAGTIFTRKLKVLLEELAKPAA